MISNEVQSVNERCQAQCESVSFLSVHVSRYSYNGIFWILYTIYEGRSLFGVPHGGGVQLVLEKVEKSGWEKQDRQHYEEQLCELLGDQWVEPSVHDTERS